MTDFDNDLRLRAQHYLGEPIAILVGYLALFTDGDVTLEDIVTHMTQATLDLTIQLAELAEEIP